MKRLSGIIFSNIYDSALGDLTAKRTVASLPFGGRYRQIDFVLSNMVNSNIASVGVITKYNYESLMDHLGSCEEWDLNRKSGGLYIIPPFAFGRSDVYHGKLEALYTALHFLKSQNTEYIVLSDTITICNIDYREVLANHIKSGRDITAIASKPRSGADSYPAVFEADGDGSAKSITINCAARENSLVGIGMFIMEREALIKVVTECVSAGFYHFEKDFLQKYFNENKITVNVYNFEETVLRNRDIATYLKNNILLTDEKIRGSLFKSSAPIYTKVRDEIPTYYGESSVVNECIVADGCVISGELESSVLFRDVKIEEGAKVIGSIVMQGSKIGKNSYIENAIIDKNVTITEGTRLIGSKLSPVIIRKGETV
ncbi:MAG: glucose-1-phosphate adenylyltransferase subunit GlgD [Ruminococcaceae bacterium]|nr:glucose-1-phosphate adenylyltransferase subunit GlgD [Oscillospiraceae bacterium]